MDTSTIVAGRSFDVLLSYAGCKCLTGDLLAFCHSSGPQ